MFNKYIVVFLFLSINFSYLSIKDKKIYNNNSNIYYTHDEFIELLDTDSNFSIDKDYKKYKKYHNRLKFKRSWIIYLLSIGSISAGIEGIQNPEKWEEGGDNYEPESEPPGIGNIVSGGLVYAGYFGYNTSKRDSSLVKTLNKYNALKFYWEDDVPILISGYNSYSFKNFNLSFEGGLFSEKSVLPLASLSLSYKVIESYEIFFNVGSSILLFNAGFGSKYYFKPNQTYSPFISFSSYYVGGVTDSGSQAFKGINLSSGLSISNVLTTSIFPLKKPTYNIGISACWIDDTVVLLPFIYANFRIF